MHTRIDARRESIHEVLKGDSWIWYYYTHVAQTQMLANIWNICDPQISCKGVNALARTHDFTGAVGIRSMGLLLIMHKCSKTTKHTNRNYDKQIYFNMIIQMWILLFLTENKWLQVVGEIQLKLIKQKYHNMLSAEIKQKSFKFTRHATLYVCDFNVILTSSRF